MQDPNMPPNRPPRPGLPDQPEQPSSGSGSGYGGTQRPRFADNELSERGRSTRPERPERLESASARPQAIKRKADKEDWSGLVRKAKSKLVSARALRLKDLPWVLRSGWRNSGWFGRVFGVMLAFMLIGTLSDLVGCNQPYQTPKQILQQSGNNQLLAKLIDQTASQTQSVNYLQSSNSAMKLRAVYQSDPRLVVLYTQQGVSAVDSDGKSWSWNNQCWNSQGRGESPSPLAVALPLSQQNIRFSDPVQTGQTWTVPFHSENLGSWGPGDGKMIIRNKKIEEFTYQTDDGVPENRFILSYPSKHKQIKIQPRC